MNILSFIHIHRLPNPSGVGRAIDRLLTTHAARYPAARHRMLVDESLYNQVYLQLPEHWKKASFIPCEKTTSWQQASWIWRNKPLAESFWNDVEMVYCPAESYVPTDKAKLVCTIHDVAGFESDLYPNDIKHKFHCLKWTQLFTKMAKEADAVVTVSNFSASRIAHFFPKLGDKLHVVYNAPHHVFGSPVSDAVWQAIEQLSGGRPYVLVPGGLSLRKNADLVIKALPLLERQIPDLKMLIAGFAEAAYAKRIKESNFKNLVLCGYVSDEILNALYQKANAVWFPSRYEGFGMPVIEAMAAGAPVVASLAASIPEVVDDAALLCDKDDHNAHIEAIRTIIDSSGYRDDLTVKGRKQAGKFTWANSADCLDSLFTSI